MFDFNNVLKLDYYYGYVPDTETAPRSARKGRYAPRYVHCEVPLRMSVMHRHPRSIAHVYSTIIDI